MNTYDDDYFSDDEFNNDLQNPNKVIVLCPRSKSIMIDDDQEIKTDILKPSVDIIIDKCYEEMKKYSVEQAVEIMDMCSYDDFYNFMIKYKKNY